MKNMQARRSLKVPILVVSLVLILLALAWLPSQETPVQQRPYVDLHVSYAASNPRLEQVATDIRYRMNTHHSYRLVSENLPLTDDFTLHRVQIELSEADKIIYLRALVNEQSIEVNGPRNAVSSLSSKLFSLINDTLEQA